MYVYTVLSQLQQTCPLTAVSNNLQAKQKLSEDDLERLIDALEKMHHAEIQKHPEQWANLIGSPLMAGYSLYYYAVH